MYLFIILGSISLFILLFLITFLATKWMHKNLLIWKYFNRISKMTGKKVQPAFGKIKIDKTKKEELRYYLMSCLLWHYPKDRVVEACVKIGWNKEFVEQIIEEEYQKLLPNPETANQAK